MWRLIRETDGKQRENKEPSLYINWEHWENFKCKTTSMYIQFVYSLIFLFCLGRFLNPSLLQLWAAPLTHVTYALPTPSPHQHAARVHPRCLYGNKVGGVGPKLLLVWRYESWSPYAALTLRPPPRPADGLLVNPLCRQQKIWPRTQSPNHVIRGPGGQRSPRVTARRSRRGQRLMCLTTAPFLMTSPPLVVSRYPNNDDDISCWWQFVVNQLIVAASRS